MFRGNIKAELLWLCQSVLNVEHIRLVVTTGQWEQGIICLESFESQQAGRPSITGSRGAPSPLSSAGLIDPNLIIETTLIALGNKS